MLEGQQVPCSRHALQRGGFPTGVITLDLLEDLGFEDEVATVDPGAVASRLFLRSCIKTALAKSKPC
jgi:hypothetical protein